VEHRSYFANTSVFDVSNCNLTNISVDILTYMTRFMIAANLRGNMLDSLLRDVVYLNTSAKLFLGRNTWQCSCDNSWIISWLQSQSDKIRDPEDIICNSSARMRGRYVLKSTSCDFCDDREKRIFTITLSSAAAVVVILTAGLLVYNFLEKCYKCGSFICLTVTNAAATT